MAIISQAGRDAAVRAPSRRHGWAVAAAAPVRYLLLVKHSNDTVYKSAAAVSVRLDRLSGTPKFHRDFVR